MVGRMPILGEYDVDEPTGEMIDRGNDFVPVRHRQTSPGAEIILNIDNDQDVAFINGNLPTHQGACSVRCRSNFAAAFAKTLPTCTGYAAPGSNSRNGAGRLCSSRAACSLISSSVGGGETSLPVLMNRRISSLPSCLSFSSESVSAAMLPSG